MPNVQGSMIGNIAHKVARKLVQATEKLPGANNATGTTIVIAALLGGVVGAVTDPRHPFTSIGLGMVTNGFSQWISEKSAYFFDLDGLGSDARSHATITLSGAKNNPYTIEGAGFLAAGVTGALAGVAQSLWEARSESGVFNVFNALKGATYGFLESATTSVLAQHILRLGTVRPKGRGTVLGGVLPNGQLHQWTPNGPGFHVKIEKANPPPEIEDRHKTYLANLGNEQAAEFHRDVLAAKNKLSAFLKKHGYGHVDLEKCLGPNPIYLARGNDRGGEFNEYVSSDHRTQLNFENPVGPLDPNQPERLPFNWCRSNAEKGYSMKPFRAQWSMLAAMIPAAIFKTELDWNPDKNEVVLSKGVAKYLVGGRDRTKQEVDDEKAMRRFNLGSGEYLAWVANGEPIELPNREDKGTKMLVRFKRLADEISRSAGPAELDAFHKAILDAHHYGDLNFLARYLCASHPITDTQFAAVKAFLVSGDLYKAYTEARKTDESPGLGNAPVPEFV